LMKDGFHGLETGEALNVYLSFLHDLRRWNPSANTAARIFEAKTLAFHSMGHYITSSRYAVAGKAL
jgi:hypothetical protein